MKTEQICKKIKEIIYPIHSHQDQMMAIVKWIEAEFEPKPDRTCDHRKRQYIPELKKDLCLECGKLIESI